MWRISLVLLAACASGPAVVTWRIARPGGEERVEVRSNGDVQYTAINGGVEEKPETLRLSTEQVSELDDMLRNQHACELKHDPGYTPAADEGQTTLTVAFPDQQCKITLFHKEWQHGRAHEISETMRSMRLRPK
jgi:hypothetical protein